MHALFKKVVSTGVSLVCQTSSVPRLPSIFYPPSFSQCLLETFKKRLHSTANVLGLESQPLGWFVVSSTILHWTLNPNRGSKPVLYIVRICSRYIYIYNIIYYILYIVHNFPQHGSTVWGSHFPRSSCQVSAGAYFADLAASPIDLDQ